MKKLIKENLIIFYAIFICWLPAQITTGIMEATFFYKVGFWVAFITILFLSLVALLLTYLWLKDKSDQFVLINTPLVLCFLFGILGILFTIFTEVKQGAWIPNMIGLTLSVTFFIVQLVIWLVLFITSKFKKHSQYK